jgi:hypothetical protein
LPNRDVISASGISSIWCDRDAKSSASMFFGMWHDTQRLPSVPVACRECSATRSLKAWWHCRHISFESRSNFNDVGLSAVFAGCGSWHDPHVALPRRKHADRENASAMKVLAR